MRNSLCLGALTAAALVAGAAAATPITGHQAAEWAIDVEFWGRLCPCGFQQLDPKDPSRGRLFIGDPVRGGFRIWTADAPAPTPAFGYPDENMAVYGRDTLDGPRASFVTSRLRSPVPDVYDVVSPVPGGAADDRVLVGDGPRRVGGSTPLADLLEVSDAFAKDRNLPTEGLELLSIIHRAPLDSIHGLGLDQQYEVSTPFGGDNGGGAGFFWRTVDGVRQFFSFTVEWLRVSKVRVCRP
jgi:hypothetical protein